MAKPDNEKVPRREIITALDIKNITGKTLRTARKILAELRRKLGKEDHHFVTVKEFAYHVNMDEDSVRRGMGL